MKANTRRMLGDFRETNSELLLDELTKVWAGWAESHEASTCNQANGSPNIRAAAGEVKRRS